MANILDVPSPEEETLSHPQGRPPLTITDEDAISKSKLWH